MTMFIAGVIATVFFISLLLLIVGTLSIVKTQALPRINNLEVKVKIFEEILKLNNGSTKAETKPNITLLKTNTESKDKLQ